MHQKPSLASLQVRETNAPHGFARMFHDAREGKKALEAAAGPNRVRRTTTGSMIGSTNHDCSREGEINAPCTKIDANALCRGL